MQGHTLVQEHQDKTYFKVLEKHQEILILQGKPGKLEQVLKKMQGVMEKSGKN